MGDATVIDRIDAEIEDVTARILSAATIEGAAKLHHRLDVLREKRETVINGHVAVAYERGYRAGLGAAFHTTEETSR